MHVSIVKPWNFNAASTENVVTLANDIAHLAKAAPFARCTLQSATAPAEMQIRWKLADCAKVESSDCAIASETAARTNGLSGRFPRAQHRGARLFIALGDAFCLSRSRMRGRAPRLWVASPSVNSWPKWLRNSQRRCGGILAASRQRTHTREYSSLHAA